MVDWMVYYMVYYKESRLTDRFAYGRVLSCLLLS